MSLDATVEGSWPTYRPKVGEKVLKPVPEEKETAKQISLRGKFRFLSDAIKLSLLEARSFTDEEERKNKLSFLENYALTRISNEENARRGEKEDHSPKLATIHWKEKVDKSTEFNILWDSFVGATTMDEKRNNLDIVYEFWVKNANDFASPQ